MEENYTFDYLDKLCNFAQFEATLYYKEPKLYFEKACEIDYSMAQFQKLMEDISHYKV